MKQFLTFSKHWVQAPEVKSATSKVKASVIAIVLGFVLAGILLACMSHNPFEAFTEIFKSATNKNNIQYTYATIGVLLLAGIANGIAFKTGLFNIGVSGQMFFSGALVVLMGVKMIGNQGATGIFVLVILATLIGALVAAFSGLLKALFNVHEVVSTILLNWSLYYIAKWIIHKVKITDYSGATKIVPGAKEISTTHNGLMIFMIGIAIAVVLLLVLWKTTLGYNLKTTGLSKEAARYAGMKVNRNIIVSMALSGLVAGLAGGLMFVVKERQVGTTYLNNDFLPTEGFDGIAIALLAFSNPVGMVPISVLFGILEKGAVGLSSLGIAKEVSNLVIGVIIYFAAISILFERFKPVKMIWTFFKYRRTDKYHSFRKMFKKEYKEAVTSDEKKIARHKFRNEVRSLRVQASILIDETLSKHYNYYYSDAYRHELAQIKKAKQAKKGGK